MSRVQLALNVSNIDEAVTFYEKLFATAAYKRKPGYANFVIAEPPLKLVLIESGEGGTLNHLGVEVETAQEVSDAEGRLAAEGVATTGVDDTTCCYALKTETWVRDPDGAPWEWYVKNGDVDQMSDAVSGDEGGQCCTPGGVSEPIPVAAPTAASSCACC